VAQRVEGQLEGSIAGQQLPLVTERVLVLVDGSPAAMRAVRRAASLAGALHAGLVAVAVETPASERQPFDRRRDLQEALDDATDLGAEVVRIEAKDLMEGLSEAVASRRATHLVLPRGEADGLRRVLERPLADRLLDRHPELEIHLIDAAPRTPG
jgi:two-component system sensor histidine kinase KdpD